MNGGNGCINDFNDDLDLGGLAGDCVLNLGHLIDYGGRDGFDDGLEAGNRLINLVGGMFNLVKARGLALMSCTNVRRDAVTSFS